MNIRESEGEEPTYRIGAVSRLTGVAPDTLRVWERRYGAVTPHRSGTGVRLYSQDDVARLALIKRLVDAGDAISRVANLTKDQLQERAKGSPLPDAGAARPGPCRVAVLGRSLAERLRRESTGEDGLEVLGAFPDREAFLAEAPRLGAEVVVLDYPTIQPDDVRDIGLIMLRCGAPTALVVYGFASSATLERLESQRIVPIRGPLDRAQLRRWCLALQARSAAPPALAGELDIDISGPLPARRFDEPTLASIAAASVTVRCECPHHLVDLISRLAAFETYSEECEVLNVDDAALHSLLHAATAHARHLLEIALARVIEADGIPTGRLP
jgi:DNA-binding transcriptional MerR regulator